MNCVDNKMYIFVKKYDDDTPHDSTHRRPFSLAPMLLDRPHASTELGVLWAVQHEIGTQGGRIVIQVGLECGGRVGDVVCFVVNLSSDFMLQI